MYFSGETIQSVLQSNGFSCQFCDMVLNSLEQLEQHRIGKIIKMYNEKNQKTCLEPEVTLMTIYLTSVDRYDII
jgi:hypothetical protein